MKISIDYSAVTSLQEKLRRSPDVVREELLEAMAEADGKLQRQVADLTPKASGLLKGSITSEETVTEFGVVGIIGSPENYVIPVELGTRPHFPPVEKLIDWVKLRFPGKSETEARSIAFLVARKISRKGTKGEKMFAGALRQLEPEIETIFKAATQRIAARILGET